MAPASGFRTVRAVLPRKFRHDHENHGTMSNGSLLCEQRGSSCLAWNQVSRVVGHDRGRFAGAMATVPRTGRASGPAEQYLEAQLHVVRSLDAKREAIANIADEAAQRLLAGGTIHLAGEKGMVAEMMGRAGGLCGAKMLSLEKGRPRVGLHDVVLLSDYGAPGKLKTALARFTGTEALVVVFASAENPLLRQPWGARVRVVPVDIPLDSRLLVLRSGQRLIPLVSPAIATAEWTFVAELLGACRRKRRQLAVYLSIWLDPGRRRFERTNGLLVEPDLRPAPVARGLYAHDFLASTGQASRPSAAKSWGRSARRPIGSAAVSPRIARSCGPLRGTCPRPRPIPAARDTIFPERFPSATNWARNGFRKTSVRATYTCSWAIKRTKMRGRRRSTPWARGRSLSPPPPLPPNRPETRGTCTSTRTGREAMLVWNSPAMM